MFSLVLSPTDEQYNNLLNTRALITVTNVCLSNRCFTRLIWQKLPIHLEVTWVTCSLYLRPWLHETGRNSDRYDFRSIYIQMLVSVYIRPVWKIISCRFHSFRLLNRHEWLGPVLSRTSEPCKHELICDWSKITVLSMRMSVVGPFQDGGKQERV